MADLYEQFAQKKNTTPQTEQARPDQVVNNADGFIFGITDFARAKRFLILGSDSGTYYQTAALLTKENASSIQSMADSEHDHIAEALVNLIVDVSVRGLAPKVQPALFALAIAANGKNVAGRAAAKAAVTKVVRTGSHLLTYIKYVDLLGGWSRGKRGGVNSFYEGKDADQLAYQFIKYFQREGWDQRDVLRVTHPKLDDPAKKDLFDWVTKKDKEEFKMGKQPPRLILDFDLIKRTTDNEKDLAFIIAMIEVERSQLSWEMIPDWALTKAIVWETLLENDRVPMTALLRNLARLTNLGVIKPFFGEQTHKIVDLLTNQDKLVKARIHPINILIAAKTYAKGLMRDGTRYTPVTDILVALDKAFHLAFGAIEPAGKRTLIGLDVSGSMWSATDPSGNLTAAEAGAAMALVLAATEPWTEVFAFTAMNGNRGGYYNVGPTHFQPMNIRGTERLNDLLRFSRELTNVFGRTDCSLPMQEALKNNWEVDTFIVITDNETYEGSEHPYQSLTKYRKSSPSRKDAKLIVLSVTASNFTIADPNDPMGQLDICGFGSDVPQLVTAFSKG